MKRFTEFVLEQTEDTIRKKLKLALAKSKRLGRQPKVGYLDKKTKKVKSGQYTGLIKMHGFTYAKIEEPDGMSTVPLPDVRTVIP